jgi:hypothetical protein
MAACPNCGRQTLRTKDWVCQWCGYPLISRAFKKIDKTYKELQEERALGASSVDTGTDASPGYEAETTPEPEPERKPQKEAKPGFSLFGKPKPRPEPTPRPTPRPEPRREPESQPPEQEPPRPASRPAPVFRPAPQPEASRQPEPPVAGPIITPPPAPKAELPPASPAPRAETPAQPISQPQENAAPPSKPEIVIEYQPPYVSSVKAEDIKDGVEVSADDLDALFKADKAGVNLKLTGKTIILKGVVEKVFIREHLDIRYIMVTGRKKLSWSSRCTFEKETAGKASRLSEGADVAVRAKYDGYGKNIIFKECEVL